MRRQKRNGEKTWFIVVVCLVLMGLIGYHIGWFVIRRESPKTSLAQENPSNHDARKNEESQKALNDGKQATGGDAPSERINEKLPKDEQVKSTMNDNPLKNDDRKDAFDPYACSREAVGKKVLQYLWCNMGMCRGTHERIVEDGRFSVRLVDYWQKEPTVSKIAFWDVRYRFMNEDKTKNKQWISIEHMDPPEGMSTDGDIGRWVDVMQMITGKPDLNIPDNQDFTVLKFDRISQQDDVFMQKHGLKQMASYAGTIKIDDTVCCLYMVLMQKGRESWKMEVVFPAANANRSAKDGANDSTPEDQALVFTHLLNMKIAGMFIGHFKILD
jgi:hypothetical protein